MKFLIMYIALPITLILACLYLIVFSDDVYRYPCQDPANWESVECQPPQCEAMGLCTKYLIDLTGIELETPAPELQFSDSVTSTSETPNE